jgi:hypothetical protein
MFGRPNYNWSPPPGEENDPAEWQLLYTLHKRCPNLSCLGLKTFFSPVYKPHLPYLLSTKRIGETSLVGKLLRHILFV